MRSAQAQKASLPSTFPFLQTTDTMLTPDAAARSSRPECRPRRHGTKSFPGRRAAYAAAVNPFGRPLGLPILVGSRGPRRRSGVGVSGSTGQGRSLTPERADHTVAAATPKPEADQGPKRRDHDGGDEPRGDDDQHDGHFVPDSSRIVGVRALGVD